MTFEYTTDAALIRSIVTHPKIWPDVSDDFTPAADDWRPGFASARPLYLVPKDGAEVLGVWLFEARGACWEIHTSFLPEAWGPRARQASAEMLAWLWSHTACRRLITNVPSYNRRALRFAERAGLTQFGVNERAYLKDGTLHDLILLGISKPD
jgi:RimJ/RimL family protein N-acetyltransferase